MTAYNHGQANMFCSCGNFLLLSVFFLTIVSSQILHVYYTSTHDVALVWIQISNLHCNAGLKCAARGSLKILHAKNRHLCSIARICQAMSCPLSHVLTTRKKLVKQQRLLHMSWQYGELRPTNDWYLFGSLGHCSKFQWVSHIGFIIVPISFNGGQLNFVHCLPVC